MNAVKVTRIGDEVKTNEKHIQKKNHSKESNLVENLL